MIFNFVFIFLGNYLAIFTEGKTLQGMPRYVGLNIHVKHHVTALVSRCLAYGRHFREGLDDHKMLLQ
jgi:hypothetical protein